MKNLFFALAFLFIGSISFADNNYDTNNTKTLGSCVVAVTTISSNMFGQTIRSTSYHYLGEVSNNGFGAIDCELRARRFVSLYY